MKPLDVPLRVQRTFYILHCRDLDEAIGWAAKIPTACGEARLTEALRRLAQVNIARMVAPLTDPVMTEFVANLEPINALARADCRYRG